MGCDRSCHPPHALIAGMNLNLLARPALKVIHNPAAVSERRHFALLVALVALLRPCRLGSRPEQHRQEKRLQWLAEVGEGRKRAETIDRNPTMQSALAGLMT